MTVVILGQPGTGPSPGGGVVWDSLDYLGQNSHRPLLTREAAVDTLSWGS